MSLSVHSEIGPLKEVLIHRPGPELERLTPAHMERMLFDDIPFLDGARREHDRFAALLREQGVTVRYLTDLVTETLDQDPKIRQEFIASLIHEAGDLARYHGKQLTKLLNDIPDNNQLVFKAMAGVTENELPGKARSPLAKRARHLPPFVLDPIPNLYFTRDPYATIGHGATIHRMANHIRQRETLFSRMILTMHPRYRAQVPLYFDPSLPFSIEGGDILVLSEKLLAIGLSLRTTAEAIELLAQRLFKDPDCQINEILALDIPNIRAYMHLDTVFTQVDRDAFTIHPGILPTLRIYRVRPGAKGGIKVDELKEKPEKALARAMGLDIVRLIPCGGQDRVASEREQWNDGSNTLCIAPGKVVVYDRNTITNAILRDNGFDIIEVPSGELARGRGGPRCMSMPLVRDIL